MANRWKAAICWQGEPPLWFMISNYIDCIDMEGFCPPSYLHPSEDTAHACGHGFGDFGFWMLDRSFTFPV